MLQNFVNRQNTGQKEKAGKAIAAATLQNMNIMKMRLNNSNLKYFDRNTVKHNI